MNWVSLLAAAAPAAPAATGLFWESEFGRKALWADGQAEVSTYEARDVKYGVSRAYRALLIVVAEDFNGEKLVKADRPAGEPRTLRVLKLNHVRAIQTGVYAYQQMLSVYLGAERLDPIKLTVTSHEWFGNSFVEWREDRRLLSIRSYSESVGDRDLPLWPGDALFDDGLPLKLRALDFDRTREGKLTVLDTLFSNAPSAPVAGEATLRVSRADGAAYCVEILRGADRDAFDFETDFPHRPLRWERSDGGLPTLIDSRRFRYWESNRPSHEALLPAVPAR